MIELHKNFLVKVRQVPYKIQNKLSLTTFNIFLNIFLFKKCTCNACNIILKCLNIFTVVKICKLISRNTKTVNYVFDTCYIRFLRQTNQNPNV